MSKYNFRFGLLLVITILILLSPIISTAQNLHGFTPYPSDLKEILARVQLQKESLPFTTTNFPADRYALAVYDNGSGWYGSCYDVTNGGWLTMDQMASALTASGGLDLLMFTAPCLMGSLESVYELRDVVDVYIGSEEVEADGGQPGGNIRNGGINRTLRPQVNSSVSAPGLNISGRKLRKKRESYVKTSLARS